MSRATSISSRLLSLLCKWAISNHNPSKNGAKFDVANSARIVHYGVEWNRVVLKTVFIGCVIMLRKFATVGLAVIALCVSASSVSAQSWADQLVEPKKIDFGVIATGSESVREIKITNSTPNIVHISGTAPGCQCVMPGAPSQNLLQPGEVATIEVRMNTRSFKQQRDTYLTITFDAPQLTTVRVPVSAYIRTDVVFTPGKIDFGSKDVGAGGEVTCKIAYAGRPDWKILDVKYTNKNLNAVLKEIARNPSAGTADFELTMTLSPDASVGRIREIVTIVTDDATSPNVPLIVEGVVQSDIRVATESVSLGALKPGEMKTVPVVVTGSKPFAVAGVDCEKMPGCFSAKLVDEAKKQQIIKLEFTAPNDPPGKFTNELVISIKDRKETYKCKVSGEIR